MIIVPGQIDVTPIIDTFRDDYRPFIGDRNLDTYKSGRYWEYGLTFNHGDFAVSDVVLDVGGGFSYFMVYLVQFIKVGVIIDNVSFTWPRPTFWDWYKTLFDYPIFIDGKLSIMIWDAVSLPFPNDFFDKVVSISALEHFGDGNDTKAAREIRRVLKPDGYFIGTVDFNLKTEYPDVDGNPYAYTYDSFFNRIVNPSGLKLCDEFEPFVDVGDRTDYVSSLFFKLEKA